MGQQQLLLVILVTIIVGIATVVAINTFGSAADNANRESVQLDVTSIQAAAQGYYLKPTMLGGGGRSFAEITFHDFNFPAEGISSDSLTAYNENGTYVISNRAAGSFDVTGHPSSDDNYDATAPLTATANDPITATVTPQ